jgi:hypothetical protein
MEQIPKKDIVALNSSLIFKIAESDIEKIAIYDSRVLIAGHLFPFLFKSNQFRHTAKDNFDDNSYLFYCSDSSVIASCRASPYFNGKWEISDNLPDTVSLNFNIEKTLQLNRVYIDENYRNRAIHEFMFYYFALWVTKSTSFDQYFCSV